MSSFKFQSHLLTLYNVCVCLCACVFLVVSDRETRLFEKSCFRDSWNPNWLRVNVSSRDCESLCVLSFCNFVLTLPVGLSSHVPKFTMGTKDRETCQARIRGRCEASRISRSPTRLNAIGKRLEKSSRI